MDGIIYRDAAIADARALAELFRATFIETFGHLYRAEDLEAFLSEHQEPQWSAQLANPHFATRIAERYGRVAAYAKIGLLKLPVEDADNPAELHQLYLAEEVRGSGVAVELMAWVVGKARDWGARNLYLSVFTENYRARRFYARYGFEEVGPYAFMVGEQADEDIILRLKL